MTTKDKKAINDAKEILQLRFEGLYGFAPTKKQIVPLEVSFETDKMLNLYYVSSLLFRIRDKEYLYRIGQPILAMED